MSQGWDVDGCVVQEQWRFIWERNTIMAQDTCLEIEQNICHFETHPD